jgi:two-component system chemotaxis response regulator CheB
MQTHDLVVIGASVGGVPALRRLVAELPEGLPAALCVVQHVGARPSLLPELLTAVGPLPALHPEDGQRLQHGHVYVAPPDHHLLVDGPLLRLSRGPREHHTRPAVDPLFRSAALSYGPRAIGVLLTGALDDGSAGMAAIQACGGLTVVQDPADAEDPSMPAAALQAVRVDHCVPLSRLAPLLAELVATPAPAASEPPPQRLVIEHLAATHGGMRNMDELSKIGRPSTLVCPDCHGTLWELKGNGPLRYRCHTGHAFSLRSLAAQQSQATEEALWSALRALQEKELLLHKVADLERMAGDETRAQQATAQATEVAMHLRALRRLVEHEDITSPQARAPAAK